MAEFFIVHGLQLYSSPGLAWECKAGIDRSPWETNARWEESWTRVPGCGLLAVMWSSFQSYEWDSVM